MEPNEILMELEESARDGSLQIFRKLITCGSSSHNPDKPEIRGEQTLWKPVLNKLLELLGKTRDHGKEQILLIPHAFVVLLYQQYGVDEFKSILQSYFLLDSTCLHFFGSDYDIQDLDLFKLLITHGYLQLNQSQIYVETLCELLFEVLYDNCIRYTRYTYLAYKLLGTWLEKTGKTNFWINNEPSIEKKLEMIIYSNWDNSIKEISKQNCTSIFNQYLKIMNNKYKGFLTFLFRNCINNISWLNETKYKILSEVCAVSNNVKAFTEREFILAMLTCLTQDYLRSAGTKLYNVISNKLGEEQWKDVFGYPIQSVVLEWEFGPRKNDQALQLFCTLWLEPTIVKHRTILPFLWELSNNVSNSLFRSHLERIASQTGVCLEGGNIRALIDDCNEYLRLNSFATHCQKSSCLKNYDLGNHFSVVKHFLFYNVNCSSTFLRRGIIKYFKIFFLNLLKSCNTEQYYNEEVFHIFQWLHEFFLDSFEIGSCYQRQILGIKLYEMVLFYTNEREISYELKIDPRYREDFKNGFKMQKELEYFAESIWMLTNRTSLLSLFKLILEPATDIRQISAEIILQHFQSSSLNDSEKMVLLETAITKCNSSKFYETESGSTLIKILSKWLPISKIPVFREMKPQPEGATHRFYTSVTAHTMYIEYMLKEAQNQLSHVKKDILRAAMQNSPFHGTLTTILNVGYRSNLKTELMTVEFTEKLLKLLENSVDFFLSLLSSKSSNSEFSSSFAEMGLAIDKTVKDSEIRGDYDIVALSPAHQLVITCIWISLKVSCELASEIGMLMYSPEIIERAANLICLVLIKCRHKGAIEAAGVAIGHLTRKLVNVEKYSYLPEKWLNDLTSGQNINPNLTRRSAGLSIMFHRIIANDNRHGRPLVHIGIRNLLSLLEINKESAKYKRLMKDENESHEDLPRAKHLHFLQRLVAESDLHAQVVPYLERITIECFKNLQSQIWIVRNASLQLFGAIVPRIAGQYNGGQTLGFGNGYSVDHFIMHYPTLANYILMELKTAAAWGSDFNATLNSHSAIVPSIILLSQMFTGGSDFIDYSSKTYIHDVKYHLKLLFGSPIGNVRILAAKAYAALVPFPKMTSEYKNLKNVVVKVNHQNHAHGYMYAIKYLNEKFKIENATPCNAQRSGDLTDDIHSQCQKNLSIWNSCNESLEENTSRVSSINKIWNDMYDSNVKSKLCYLVEAMSLLVFQDLNNSHDIFLFREIGEDKDSVLNIESHKPGFGEFINTSTRLYVDKLNHSENIDKMIIKRILNSQCIDQSLTLLNNLESEATLPNIILNHLLQFFPNCEETLLDAMVHYLNKSIKKSFNLWNKLTIPNVDDIRYNVCQLIEIISSNRRYTTLEQFCHILINALDFDSKSIDAMIIYCCSKGIDKDEIIRKLAAECLPCMLRNFSKTDNNNKLKIWKLCLTLLKDEVLEIREIVRVSLADFFNKDYPPLADILYHKILEQIIIDDTDYASLTILEIVEFFKEWLMSFNFKTDSKLTVESPFDHEDDATSAEETKLLNIIFFSVSQLGNTVQNDSQINENTSYCGDVMEAKNQILKNAKIEFSDLKSMLDLNYNDYMIIKRDIVLELCDKILKSIKR